jgi:hypothetical protein
MALPDATQKYENDFQTNLFPRNKTSKQPKWKKWSALLGAQIFDQVLVHLKLKIIKKLLAPQKYN